MVNTLASKNDTTPAPKHDILIVDDEPNNTKLLADILQKEGYEIRRVLSGRQALKVIDVEPPDLVLLDIRMPNMNGYEVCTKLKDNPKTSKIPIIFLSAANDAASKVQGFAVGGEDYISKPFQVEEVLTRIEHQLQIQQLTQSLQQHNQALARKNRTLQTLNQLFSHEFLEPLNVLKLSLDILQEDCQDQLEKQNQELFEFANEAIQRQTQAVEQLLVLTNPKLSNLHFDVVQLDTIATKIVDQLKQRQPERNVTWQIEPNCTAICDPSLLTIVLHHLLENAWNFTKLVSQPCIEFGRCSLATLPLSAHPPASSSPLSQDTILYYVRDNGIGFEPTQAEKLFDSCHFLNPDSPFSSTGIGLTIIEQLIHAHQGMIWATGQPQQGATFYFLLPL